MGKDKHKPKKPKKDKKQRSGKHKSRGISESASYSEEEWVEKPSRNEPRPKEITFKHKSRDRYNSSSCSEEEWVEKPSQNEPQSSEITLKHNSSNRSQSSSCSEEEWVEKPSRNKPQPSGITLKHRNSDRSESSSYSEEEWVERSSRSKPQPSEIISRHRNRDRSESSSYSEKEWVEKSSQSKPQPSEITSKHRNRDRSESSSRSEEEWVEKPSRNQPQRSEITLKHRSRDRSESSSCSEEEWVEKSSQSQPQASKITLKRDEWLTLPTKFTSTSNADRKREREEARRLEREREQYDPRSNVRELNPFWRYGGDGLPKFKQPKEDAIYGTSSSKSRNDQEYPSGHKFINEPQTEVSEKELNVLAAKIVKAELMGNLKLAAQLKTDLEKMKNIVKQNNNMDKEVILTQTDSKGHSRPVKLHSECKGNKRKKQKIETHKDGQRVRYFANDDKYSLQQLFEEEKYNAVGDHNRDFLKMAVKVRKIDDLDDIFTDDIRIKESNETANKRARSKAIYEHQKITDSLDNCRRCLQSEEMLKHLMVAMGETMYLSLPHFEPLTDGHCFIVPLRHVPCTTQLDENEWSELLTFHKALTNMFAAHDKCVIFFETALHLHRFPHTIIECIPLAKKQENLAPIYFKKAIDESETEWALNKKLIRSQGPDIRKVVPKGLPYFTVLFGLKERFAHVVEDDRYFPRNFAQEIIGGMLDLHHSKWRKPRAENLEVQTKRAQNFNVMWSPFDCTVQQ